MATRPALAAFRTLMRTQQRVFAGDAAMQAAAVLRIRDEFAARAALTDPTEIAHAVAAAHEAADFLRQNVLQVERAESAAPADAGAAADGAAADEVPVTYKATFHDDVEWGTDLRGAAEREGVPFPTDCIEYEATFKELGGGDDVSLADVSRAVQAKKAAAAASDPSPSPSIRDLRAKRKERRQH